MFEVTVRVKEDGTIELSQPNQLEEPSLILISAEQAPIVAQWLTEAIAPSVAKQSLDKAGAPSVDRNRGWIVRDGDSYLYPAGGDVGFTTDLSEAGVFDTHDDAELAAHDHCDRGYVIERDPR